MLGTGSLKSLISNLHDKKESTDNAGKELPGIELLMARL